MRARVIAAVLATLLLAGCTTPTVVQPVPTATPRTETATGPTIEARSAALEPVRQSVPPVRVQVADAKIDIPVIPVGVLADGEMELPADPTTAGWYRFGPDPVSETGTTVIAAHVDTYQDGLGPFANLRYVAAGAPIVVTTGDGAEHRYAVESVQYIPRDELPLDQVFDRNGPPRLMLITCGGTFEDGQYSDNVVLTAAPIA